jgi:hypothetical protein
MINIDGINYIEISNDAAENVVENTYFININGQIYSKLSNNFMNPTYNGEYYVVNLKLKNGNRGVFYVHRILMITFQFIPNYKDMQVNHIDANKMNNDIHNNLEWTTLQGNNEHARLHGLLVTGEDCPWSILTKDQVEEICQTLQDKTYSSLSELARKYNCSITTIGDIARGVTWKDVSCNYNLNYILRNKFTEKEIHFICTVFSQNKEKSFQYLYYLIIFHLGLEDDKYIRRRIYKLYTKDKNNYYNITKLYDY